MKFTVEPIGYISNNLDKSNIHDYSESLSSIVINKELESSLDSIDGFSHIIVIYWMNMIPESERNSLKVHPRGNKELPLTGVLATRSPARMNPIGISTVKLIERNQNTLTVKGLDAYNGTPVIDIKPFIPDLDSTSDVTVVPWPSQIKKY
jgi:tRNA-Thr(GGU) m(6)t(6)A37 methyltransferase TsaA